MHFSSDGLSHSGICKSHLQEEKFHLWIEPPGGKNFYNGVGFVFASERGHI